MTSSITEIVHFQLASTIGALTIEVETGMKHSRGSVLKVAQNRYGLTSRTKKGALRELRVLYKQTFGRSYGEDSLINHPRDENE